MSDRPSDHRHTFGMEHDTRRPEPWTVKHKCKGCDLVRVMVYKPTLAMLFEDGNGQRLDEQTLKTVYGFTLETVAAGEKETVWRVKSDCDPD